MRTLYAFIVQTLDGYYEGPNREFDWPNVDDEFYAFSVEQMRATDMLLFGRVTYEFMADYWPTEAAKEDDPAVAERMNAIPKIVFSSQLERAEWNNSRLVRGDVADEIAELKRQPGKDLGIFGSLDFTKSLIEMGLLDELRVMVHPIVLGDGHSLLRGVRERVPLRLLDSRVFESGNVLLRYEPLTAQ
jgi:dihydrofolate reductase